MNKEIKARWVEALRSGKYKQGKKCLRSESDTYCCLGVLCDIKQKDIWENSITFDSFPPSYILDWAKLDFHTTINLADMNDNGGASFEEIADWIETNL